MSDYANDVHDLAALMNAIAGLAWDGDWQPVIAAASTWATEVYPRLSSVPQDAQTFAGTIADQWKDARAQIALLKAGSADQDARSMLQSDLDGIASQLSDIQASTGAVIKSLSGLPAVIPSDTPSQPSPASLELWAQIVGAYVPGGQSQALPGVTAQWQQVQAGIKGISSSVTDMQTAIQFEQYKTLGDVAASAITNWNDTNTLLGTLVLS